MLDTILKWRDWSRHIGLSNDATWCTCRNGHGGENNDVCDIMDVVRGPDRGSSIRGRSVHNQRIERSWRDLWVNVTHMFYELFYFMEERRLLDMTDHHSLRALHLVFLPRINQALKVFRQQWNCHGLRTAGHRTPIQLFVQGTLALHGSNHTAPRDLFDRAWEEVESPAALQEPVVDNEVPPDVARLISESANDDLGIDTFLAVRQSLNQCNVCRLI
jgi:hypothetical protein